ncbi:hypothetical protein SAMN02745196_03103 [Clostridium collagenovorans DSM 3089]|uniref:Uncharacterized protein n=1 Tax=Clostridium collagenovorans DSM 3089 TaxID=1121306 RepID=A0A1M5YMX6_9CLOT|nr:hypothetical protein [Clostridium collagenovorans]SHI13346.1 hypothetical protein SAMN02745196_03103 [Clostridium collagenovorans DSM 3089]
MCRVKDMKHLNQRTMKLVNELMSFCYKYGSTNLEIKVNTTTEETTINLKAFGISISDKVLESSNELLSAPRCHEMEEYYWNLSGDNDLDTELTLVGMMIDDYSINYNKDERVLEFNIKRLN